MNVRVRSFVGLIVVLASVFAWGGDAHGVANETFGLTPHPERLGDSKRRVFAVPLEPGSVFEDAVRIYNRTDRPIRLVVYASDAETGSDGTISVRLRGSRPQGVGAWIDLARGEITLPARGELVVPFRVEVQSSDPTPDQGAIVVENTAKGAGGDLAQRLHLLVRTTAPNSPTTSVRVRPLLLRSPWIILAILGLIVALVIIWLGARRARRPKDAVVPTGELKKEREPEKAPAASRPVLRRLGESQSREPPGRRRQPAEVSVGSRVTRPARERREVRERVHREPAPPQELRVTDPRPLIDDMLVEVDEPPPPASRPPRRPKPAPREVAVEVEEPPTPQPTPPAPKRPKPASKKPPRADDKLVDNDERPRDYIPLDEL